MRHTLTHTCLISALLGAGGAARADAGLAAFGTAPWLSDVEVIGQPDAIGNRTSASQGVIAGAQLQAQALARPADVLEQIPGMVVTQHSGDGKANQYFLRGINLDHGSDFATTVNGVPVNMPSHAHGQGYSDLNFLSILRGKPRPLGRGCRARTAELSPSAASAVVRCTGV